MFEITEWLPGALTETIHSTHSRSLAWQGALAAARNYATASDAKVDTALLDEPGMYARATVKQGAVVLAEYAVQEV